MTATPSLLATLALKSRLMIGPPDSVGMIKPKTPSKSGWRDASMGGNHDSIQRMVLIGQLCDKASSGRLNSYTLVRMAWSFFIINAAKHLRAASLSAGKRYTAAETLADKCRGKSSSRYLSRWQSGESPFTRVFKTLKIQQCQLLNMYGPTQLLHGTRPAIYITASQV